MTAQEQTRITNFRADAVQSLARLARWVRKTEKKEG